MMVAQHWRSWKFCAMVAVGWISFCDPSCGQNARAASSADRLETPLSLMQLANPADAAREPSTTHAIPETGEAIFQPITVRAKGAIADEDLVGSYLQPRWTADRRFAGTRTYVIPDGAFEVEYWLKPEIPRKGSTTIEQKFEVEIGLPHRFQLDLYLNLDRNGEGGDTNVGTSIEGRYALADWGKLWGNPALYLEYTFGSGGGEDAIEGKLLLADELARAGIGALTCRLNTHWDTNIRPSTSSPEASAIHGSIACFRWASKRSRPSPMHTPRGRRSCMTSSSAQASSSGPGQTSTWTSCPCSV